MALKNAPRQNVISYSRNVMDEYEFFKNMEDDDEDDDVLGDLCEDASESEPTSPTPAEKYAGPHPSGGEKTLRAIDRQ